MTTTHYRSQDLLITSRKFERRAPYPQCYRIAELENVHVFREDPGVGRMLTGPMVGVAIVIVATAVSTGHLYLITLAAVSIAVAVAGAVKRLKPTAQELRATYHSQPVRLYATRNPETFGQVRRGLSRALEECDRHERLFVEAALPRPHR